MKFFLCFITALFCAKSFAQARLYIEPYLHSKLEVSNNVGELINSNYYLIQKRTHHYSSLYNSIVLGIGLGIKTKTQKSIYFISYNLSGASTNFIFSFNQLQTYNNTNYGSRFWGGSSGGGVLVHNMQANFQCLILRKSNSYNKKTNVFFYSLFVGTLFDSNLRKDDFISGSGYNLQILNQNQLYFDYENKSTGNKISPVIGMGINYSLNNNHKETFNINLNFNYSFVPLVYTQINIIEANNFQSTTQSLRMYGYGSGINVTIGKRINVITIKKKDV